MKRRSSGSSARRRPPPRSITRNICTIYEIDETRASEEMPAQLFIAMACYAGETLKKKIERGPLPVREALDYAAQIAAGLAAAHEAGDHPPGHQAGQRPRDR